MQKNLCRYWTLTSAHFSTNPKKMATNPATPQIKDWRSNGYKSLIGGTRSDLDILEDGYIKLI
jgi:hypothetical protein